MGVSAVLAKTKVSATAAITQRRSPGWLLFETLFERAGRWTRSHFLRCSERVMMIPCVLTLGPSLEQMLETATCSNVGLGMCSRAVRSSSLCAQCWGRMWLREANI